jgi:hypothetical protein
MSLHSYETVNKYTLRIDPFYPFCFIFIIIEAVLSALNPIVTRPYSNLVAIQVAASSLINGNPSPISRTNEA